MIKRQHYLNQIISLIDKNIIKILTGVRRSGKSVLLQQVINHLKDNGIKEENIIFIDLKSLEFLSYNTIDDLNEYIKTKSNKTDKFYLFFDEIQRIEGWQRLVNAYFSLDNFDVYVAASNSKLLRGEFASYLTGRYINIKIFPFSFSEYLGCNNASKKDLFTNYLKFGGFPSSFQLDNKTQYLNDLFDSIVFKDIIRSFEIKNVDLLIRLTLYLVSNIGQLVSASSIVKYLKKDAMNVSVNTIYNYISYLEEACLIYGVKRKDLTDNRLLNQSKKYYLVDLGFREAILKKDIDMGQSLENIVYFELLRRGYEVNSGKYKNKEIDFICMKDAKKLYIQVTYMLASKDIHKREFDPLLKVEDNYPKYVLSLDEFNMSYMGVKHFNIIEFLTSDEI